MASRGEHLSIAHGNELLGDGRPGDGGVVGDKHQVLAGGLEHAQCLPCPGDDDAAFPQDTGARGQCALNQKGNFERVRHCKKPNRLAAIDQSLLMIMLPHQSHASWPLLDKWDWYGGRGAWNR